MRTRTLLALLALVLTLPALAEAQRTRDGGWWSPVTPRYHDARYDGRRGGDWDDDDWDDDDWDDDDDRGRRRGKASRGRRGKGPAFCRSGAGHPVHGRAWCRAKGWSWQPVEWRGVVFHHPDRYDRRRRDASLMGVLGRVVLERVLGHGRRQGFEGPVDSRWVRAGRALVLQMRVGGRPLAEMVDFDGDGRVDRTLLMSRR